MHKFSFKNICISIFAILLLLAMAIPFFYFSGASEIYTVSDVLRAYIHFAPYLLMISAITGNMTVPCSLTIPPKSAAVFTNRHNSSSLRIWHSVTSCCAALPVS